jgi:dihydrofolate synthase/folylpolyglutamate synthase
VELALTAQTKLAGYREALDYLFARTTGGFKFGLERTRELLARLDNPEARYPSLHVAGTNGKGSSVATMAAVLTAAGRRVATYTSPHLIDFRERMVVDGQMIPADDVVSFIARYTPVVEEIGASFFEATTAMAFDYFARAGADVAVIEAGLGGRLDSTNVLDPLVAGVTCIGLDHTEYLGSTLDEIAREKAGIFKPGRIAVIGETNPRIRALLARYAEQQGASSVRLATDEVRLDHIDVGPSGTTCDLEWKGQRLRLTTPLTGRHQAANLAFAMTVLDAAGPPFAPSVAAWASAVGNVRIPGRFQRTGKFILDVAHNPAGVEVLVQTLRAVAPPEPIIVLLCVLRDKDWRDMIRVLSTVASRFVLTMAPTAPASRAWDLGEAAAFARETGREVDVVADFREAIDRAAAGAGSVLITGSFHTVGDAMSILPLATKAG